MEKVVYQVVDQVVSRTALLLFAINQCNCFGFDTNNCPAATSAPSRASLHLGSQTDF